MKLKKSIMAFAFALCLGLSAIAMTACGGGEVEPLFGKTLSFSGYNDIENAIYTIENKDLKLPKVLEKYFDKIDWEQTLGKTKEEVGNAQNALDLIVAKCSSELDETALHNLKFEFSSKDDAQVKIGDNTYKITSYSNTEYYFQIGDGETGEQIAIRYAGDNQFSYSSNMNYESSVLPRASSSVSISFLEQVEIQNGSYGSLYVYFGALFKA